MLILRPFSLFVLFALFVGSLGVDAQEVDSTRQADSPNQRGYLGLQLGDLTEPNLENNLVTDNAARVIRVIPESSADDGGLQAGDIILSVNGQAFDGPQGLAGLTSKLAAGSNATVEFVRDGRLRSVEFELAANPWIDIATLDRGPGLHDVKITREIRYADSENERQRLDLYVPQDVEGYPTLLWLHGGAWSSGKKEQDHALALRLAERGIAVALTNYRLSPENWLNGEGRAEGVKMPAHIEDVAAAFSWLYHNIEEQGGDTKRIFTGGHSSGAHLSMLLATNPRYLNAHKLNRHDVAGVVAVEGTYDIPDYHKTVGFYMGEEVAEQHFQAVFGSNPEDWREISPSNFVNETQTPILVVNGSERAYRHYAETLKRSLDEPRKSSVSFIRSDRRVHANIIMMMYRKQPDQLRDQIVEFLRG